MANEKIIISIITINYNNLNGLLRTINSVIAQTWRKFEWIVIDGGSTDGSRELIDKYKEYFSFSCSEPDRGIYNAMNKGIRHASGSYLLFINSGDELYDNNVLTSFVQNMYAEDIVYGDCCFVDGISQNIVKYKEDLSLFDLFYTNISHQSTFISRVLFEIEGYDETFRLAADYKMWLKWMMQGKKFRHHHSVVSRFYADGATFKYLELGKIERERSIKETMPSYIISSLKDHESLLLDYTILNNWASRRLPKILKRLMSWAQSIIDKI